MPNEKHLESCLIKLLPWILFEKFIYILALEMASPENLHCANCIGTLSFPTFTKGRFRDFLRHLDQAVDDTT